MSKVAVIGAGVTGLTTAYELLSQGFDVTVFDRNRYAAMETSFANGGQLSASNAEVWTQWGTVLKGIKWMLQADAPLAQRALAGEEAQRAGAIVVLGGGRYDEAPEYGDDTISLAGLRRVRYAAVLQRRTGLPVLVSGGSVYAEPLPESEPEAPVE